MQRFAILTGSERLRSLLWWSRFREVTSSFAFYLVEVALVGARSMQLRPKSLSARLLGPVDELGCDEPAFDRPKRQYGAERHQRKGRNKMHPCRGIQCHLHPNNQRDQRQRNDTKREEGRTIIRRRKAIVESAIVTDIGNL